MEIQMISKDGKYGLRQKRDRKEIRTKFIEGVPITDDEICWQYMEYLFPCKGKSGALYVSPTPIWYSDFNHVKALMDMYLSERMREETQEILGIEYGVNGTYKDEDVLTVIKSITIEIKIPIDED